MFRFRDIESARRFPKKIVVEVLPPLPPPPSFKFYYNTCDAELIARPIKTVYHGSESLGHLGPKIWNKLGCGHPKK